MTTSKEQNQTNNNSSNRIAEAETKTSSFNYRKCTVKPSSPRKTKHPHPYLQGNFYPVFEETVGDDGIECEVIHGTIPESLKGGQYVRTGPNTPDPTPDTGVYHLFDGHGMLHGVYFYSETNPDGSLKSIRPRYMNRWVRNQDLIQGSKFGYNNLKISVGLIMGSWASLFYIIFSGIRLLFFKWLSKTHKDQEGSGNTALTFHNSRFMALLEAGLPMETAVPSLETIGSVKFDDHLDPDETDKDLHRPLVTVTAHPKIDPKNGDFVFFPYNVVKKPWLTYSVLDKDGRRKVWQRNIGGKGCDPEDKIDRPFMQHDFAISERYSIMILCPLVLDPLKHIRQGKPILAFEEDRRTRFGLIPRDHKDFNDNNNKKIIWFETDSCFIFHTANAWDEIDPDTNEVIAVNMIACRSNRLTNVISIYQPGPDKDGKRGGNYLSDEEISKKYSLPGSGDLSLQDPDAAYLTLFRFDFKTRQTQMTTLSTVMGEFPVVNQNRLTSPNLRYVYIGWQEQIEQHDSTFKIKGITKIDVQTVISAAKEKREFLQQQQRQQDKQENDDDGTKTGEQKDNLSTISGSSSPSLVPLPTSSSSVSYSLEPSSSSSLLSPSSSAKINQYELGIQELVDLEKKASTSFYFGPNRYGGEALFVPKDSSNDNENDEDDGYLLVYVYDESLLDPETKLEAKDKEQSTELWIFDAKNIQQDVGPIAKIKIPRRIPYGFHGFYLTPEMIKDQQEKFEIRRNRPNKS